MELQKNRESLLRITGRFEGPAAEEETLTLPWSQPGRVDVYA